MTDFTKLARPYARAAFEYAQEQQQLQQWGNMLNIMAQRVADPQVVALLNNPRLTVEQKSEVCFAIGRDIEDQHFCNFMRQLAHNRRIAALPAIAAEFAQLCAVAEKKITIKVKSAAPLSEAYQTKLTQLLTAKFNRHATLDCEVDEALIGGLMIRADDYVIDGSVRGQLQRLRELVMN